MVIFLSSLVYSASFHLQHRLGAKPYIGHSDVDWGSVTVLMATQSQTDASSSGEGPGVCGGCKALRLAPHVPGRVRVGFVEEVTFALGPADRSFPAEKDVKGIHT